MHFIFTMKYLMREGARGRAHSVPYAHIYERCFNYAMFMSISWDVVHRHNEKKTNNIFFRFFVWGLLLDCHSTRIGKERQREREKTTPAKANNYSYTFCLDVKSSCPISLPFNNPYSNRSNNNQCRKKFSCTLWIIATHFHLHIISKTARRQYQISENVCSRDFYFIKRWERYVQILRNETGAKRKQNYEKRIFLAE